MDTNFQNKFLSKDIRKTKGMYSNSQADFENPPRKNSELSWFKIDWGKSSEVAKGISELSTFAESSPAKDLDLSKIFLTSSECK